MKLHCDWSHSNPPVASLWIYITFSFLISNGCLGVADTKNHNDLQDKHSETHSSLFASVTKLSRNSNGKTEITQFECHEQDKECEKDRLGFEAIKSLHLIIDDDQNGNVDLSESDEFLRDELQYTDGFERQELFHNNDKLISVDDLWKAWKHSAVYNWTVDDMIEWLVQDVDLPQYSQVFHNFAIDGSVLPRLVNSTSPLLTSLGIRNPVHKQKLSLKAMDTILFGAPKRLHSYAKDVMLFMAILLAIGISWFACLHHRYSQTQVKKMMKDLEALQKAEDALKKLSKELADAEKNQVSMPAEKQEELRMLRQNSLRLQVPRLSIGDRSPTRLNRQNSTKQKQEGEIKLKQAEEELASLREALSEAENRLEIHQQLESQWSVPEELQAWLQLTHELEQIHFNAKRQAAEKQLQMARDGCEKIKKRKQAIFGSLRMAHNNSLDDIDQSILDARAALEEVKQDLQERLHRWHTIEILCGFPVISNPGLSSLKQALGRASAGGSSRLPNSLISFDDADDDLPPTDENRESESIYNQIPDRPRQQIFAWAHRSRFNNSMKKITMSNGFTPPTGPASSKTSTFLKQQAQAASTGSLPHPLISGGGSFKGGSRETEQPGSPTAVPGDSAASSVLFQLGDNSRHERSHSSASLSLSNTTHTNINHHDHSQGKPATTLTSISSGLHGSSSSGNLPTRAGNLSLKLFSSASGNHLTARANIPQSETVVAAHSNGQSTNDKPQSDNAGDIINNNILPTESGNVSSNGQATLPTASDSINSGKTSPQDDSDVASPGSIPRNQSSSLLLKNRHDHSAELDMSSLETDSLNDSRNSAKEVSAAKNGKKKTLLPKFLKKNKGKQKI